MKKNSINFLLFFILAISISNLNAQNTTSVKAVTDSQKNVSYYETRTGSNNLIPNTKATGNVNIIWQTSDAAAIAGNVNYFHCTDKSYLSWQLNSPRVAQYSNSSTPEWQFSNYPSGTSFISSNANNSGTMYLTYFGNYVKVIDPGTGTEIWSLNTSGTVKDVVAKIDGTGFYVGIYDRKGSHYLESYTTGNDVPDWSIATSSYVVALNLASDNSKLIAGYGNNGGINVYNPETGAVIQEGLPYYNNSPTQAPALSQNGTYLAYGDFNGKGYLYKWDGSQYVQQWIANLSVAGTSSTWGCACAVSADGSTVAFGTLGFITNGYVGAIFVYNNYSPVPLWSYTSVGDEVSQISMTSDGSLIACATWGPLDHSTPDFFLFRKQSNVPIADLNTPGSLTNISMAGDGTRCIFTGKAVHEREMGSGGQVYMINPIPVNSGILTGFFDIANITDKSNTKITVESLDNYYTYTATDGSYLLKYIPAGTYTVTVTKTGYFPLTYNDITITAGQTTELNGELQPAGTSVTSLYATKGAYQDHVALTWNAYQGCTGYNIYRTSYNGEPFVNVLATVNANTTSYNDVSALPTFNYYYTVTAVLAENTETPFTEPENGYVSTSGITHTIDIYNGTAPVIDGTISEGEWDDAFKVDVSDVLGFDGTYQQAGSVIAYFKVANNKLYVATVNHNDSHLANNDRVALYIDDNGNHTYEPTGDDSEGNYWMDYVSTGNTIRYRPIYNNQSVGTTITLTGLQFQASDATGSVVMEFELPIGIETYQITPNSSNQSTMYMYVRNSDYGNEDGQWPCDNTETFSATHYGTLNFYSTNDVPPAPQNLTYDSNMIGQDFLPISWDMPEINDFGHFNVYVTLNGTTNVYQVEGTEFLLNTTGSNTQYEISVTTVDAAGQESVHSETLTINLQSGLMGDVNNDNAVDLLDIQTMIAYMLYQNPPVFIFNNGDLNSDGIINVNDLMLLVNIIVGK